MASVFLLMLLGLACQSTALAQTQLGADIDGEAAGDHSGYSASLSADGSRLAIGARNNDANGGNSGQVRVYTWSGSAWLQQGADIDGEAGDASGHSVSLSADGSRLAIGAPISGVAAGQVRVYTWSGSAWEQQGADIDGEVAGDVSGISVSLSADGSRLAIGAPLSGAAAGQVRVYTWSGSAWLQQGADLDGEAAGDSSGTSVSLSADGSRLAIGAYGNDANGGNSGQVRVYTWSGSAWEQQGSDIDGEAAGDGSGYSVSLSADGSRLAIGAPSSGAAAGQVRVYTWSGSAWLQQGADLDGEAAGDLSGSSVSLSADGSRLAIGAYGNDANGGNSGQVRVFSVWQPADAINDLKAYVNAQTFKTATKNSLIVKLNAALAALAIPDMPLACVRMQDFINLVKAQKAKKQIGATQADYMIAQATDIKLLMGCP